MPSSAAATAVADLGPTASLIALSFSALRRRPDEEPRRLPDSSDGLDELRELDELRAGDRDAHGGGDDRARAFEDLPDAGIRDDRIGNAAATMFDDLHQRSAVDLVVRRHGSARCIACPGRRDLPEFAPVAIAQRDCTAPLQAWRRPGYGEAIALRRRGPGDADERADSAGGRLHGDNVVRAAPVIQRRAAGPLTRSMGGNSERHRNSGVRRDRDSCCGETRNADARRAHRRGRLPGDRERALQFPGDGGRPRRHGRRLRRRSQTQLRRTRVQQRSGCDRDGRQCRRRPGWAPKRERVGHLEVPRWVA